MLIAEHRIDAPPPVVPYVYALETAMDELAIKLNMDPSNSAGQ